MYPDNQDSPFTIRTIVLGVIFIILVFTAILVLNDKSTPTNFTDSSTTNTPTAPAKLSSDPAFSGIETLVNYGLTTDQATGAKYAFSLYSKSLSAPLKTVKINTSTVITLPQDKNQPAAPATMVFDVLLDNKPYKAKIQFFGLSQVWLYIYNTSGKAVYESGLIDINSQTPN